MARNNKFRFTEFLKRISLSAFFVAIILILCGDCIFSSDSVFYKHNVFYKDNVFAQELPASQLFGNQQQSSKGKKSTLIDISEESNAIEAKTTSSSAASEPEKESKQISSSDNIKQLNQSSSKGSASPLDALFENSDSKSTRNLGILDLEEYLATSRYAAKPNLEERGILVRVYERIALALCFPSLNNIVKGNTQMETEPRCQEILDKLAKLHSNNTILICSQKGVESVDCARSFETQAVRKYEDGELARLDLTSRGNSPLDSPEINARFLVLQKKLLSNIDTFKAHFTISNLKSLDSSLYPVLAIICSNDGLELTIEKAKAEPASVASFGEALSIAEAINGLNDSGKKRAPTPKPTKTSIVESTTFFRSRILSVQCFDTITDALNLDPRLSSAICYRDGFIAPSCISALRRIQSLKEPPVTGTANASSLANKAKSDGLASF